jgi:hypothetical protein
MMLNLNKTEMLTTKETNWFPIKISTTQPVTKKFLSAPIDGIRYVIVNQK